MPFYANGTRVNLNSASSLYSPADSSGATCNLTKTGTATPFYANGTQIYITPSGSWHTIWTGSQSLDYGTLGGDNGTTTFTVSPAIQSSYPLRVYCTTTYGNSGYVDNDNEPVAFEESQLISNRYSLVGTSVFAPDYKSSTSVSVTTRWDYQEGQRKILPTVKATKIEAYY